MENLSLFVRNFIPFTVCITLTLVLIASVVYRIIFNNIWNRINEAEDLIESLYGFETFNEEEWYLEEPEFAEKFADNKDVVEIFIKMQQEGTCQTIGSTNQTKQFKKLSVPRFLPIRGANFGCPQISRLGLIPTGRVGVVTVLCSTN